MWLIDFGSTRDGHTLFDWANLEVSMLCDGLTNDNSNDWESLLTIVNLIIALNDFSPINIINEQTFSAIAAVARVREVVRECLVSKDNFSEYYVALAFCGLRAIGWNSMSLGGRRLAFLLSAMALLRLEQHYSTLSAADLSVSDHTDVTDHLASSIPFSGQENE